MERRAIKGNIEKVSKMKRLEDAKIGECFHFITKTGKEYHLECIELVARTRYDYNEWCVSEQTYEVYVPKFKNQYGKIVSLQGNAEQITNEDFKKQLWRTNE